MKVQSKKYQEILLKERNKISDYNEEHEEEKNKLDSKNSKKNISNSSKERMKVIMSLTK